MYEPKSAVHGQQSFPHVRFTGRESQKPSAAILKRLQGHKSNDGICKVFNLFLIVYGINLDGI